MKKVVARTLVAEKIKKYSVSVLLTNNRQIRKLNKAYLRHGYATDVISFPLESQAGDVVLSVEMARSIARRLGIPFKEEIARYLVHGVLHLLGYQDKRKRDKIKMRRRQELILKKLFHNLSSAKL